MMNLCKIEGCAGTARKLGWCIFHYDRNRRLGDPLAGGPRRVPPGALGACEVDGCDGKATARKLCVKHYYKLKKYGDPLGGKFSHSPEKRNWHINHQGYVVRYEPKGKHSQPNGYVYQHRYLMGEFLGRRLLKSENVHHINGNKADNRMENLELWISAQPAGQRVQDLLDFAREIISTYGDLVEISSIKR
jgi:hypothetical protein